MVFGEYFSGVLGGMVFTRVIERGSKGRKTKQSARKDRIAGVES